MSVGEGGRILRSSFDTIVGEGRRKLQTVKRHQPVTKTGFPEIPENSQTALLADRKCLVYMLLSTSLHFIRERPHLQIPFGPVGFAAHRQRPGISEPSLCRRGRNVVLCVLPIFWSTTESFTFANQGAQSENRAFVPHCAAA